MTEEVKHTPGPWDIEGGKPLKLHFGEETRFWVILNKDGYSPAIVPPWDVVPPIAAEEAKANARLIAAAPELLEALEQSQEMLSRLLPEWSDETRERIQKNKAAIAKAKGEA